MAVSPIADLSYRNYDGPLEPPLYRWWPIARTSIQRTFKNKWFWIVSVLSGIWYLVLMIIFYFVDSFASQLAPQRGGLMADPAQASAAMFRQVKWNELFLHGFSIGQLWFFILALMLAVGAIANDNRANALLVYLSKPCTKLDYVIGKWLGIFIPMVIAVAIPTFFFFSYCFMSYRQFGFLDDKLLIFKLLLLVIVPAFFHASVALGVSSLFKQGRLAGATYAGLFFMSLFFTKAMHVVHVTLSSGNSGATPLVDNLFYFSIDGMQIGLAKAILGTDGGNVFPFAPPGGMQQAARFTVGAPNGFVMTVVFFLICGLSLLMAWSRVRAVEVVS